MRDAVNSGIGLSPEERKSQGLLLEEPVFQNVTLSTFARFARGGVLDERRERAVSREQIEALELRPADPDRSTGTLSGGNQQKILLARWLVHGTKVLLLDEPTRGVDVGARTEIYALIRRLADAGTAIVVVSSEIEEVLGLADRVLVIADGRVLRPPRHRDRRARRARPHHGRKRRVSEQAPHSAPATASSNPAESRPAGVARRFLSGGVGRNLGLVIALLLIVVVGRDHGGRRSSTSTTSSRSSGSPRSSASSASA